MVEPVREPKRIVPSSLSSHQSPRIRRTGLIGAGAFVSFGDGHEGMIPVRRLRGDWWELNEEGTILFGSRTGAAIRLGDALTVRVQRVDAARGRVDLDLVEREE